MQSEIYYFSGSGHSLKAARDLAVRLNADLLPMPPLLARERIFSSAERIGLVFPVYHATFGESGLPHLVEAFVDKLGDLSQKYVFAVCTHNGFPGRTLANLNSLLEQHGAVLRTGFSVQLSVSYTVSEKIAHAFFQRPLSIDIARERQQRQWQEQLWQSRLNVICRVIQQRESLPLETLGAFSALLLRPYFALQKQLAVARFQQLADSSSAVFRELTAQADRSLLVNEHCNGCGICAKICPAGNIMLVDRRPIWQHHCETCMACFHWCPQHAIGGGLVEYEKRIHPAEITLTEMFTHSGAIPLRSSGL